MSDASTGKISTKLVTLTPATYDHWCSLLKDLVFALANLSSIDGITPVSMLRLDSFADVGKIPPGATAAWLACGTAFLSLNFPVAAPLVAAPTPGVPPVFGFARRVTPPIAGTITLAKQAAFDALELTNEAWYQVRKDAHKEATNRFLIAEALKTFQFQQTLATTSTPVKSVSTVLRDAAFDAWVLSCYTVAVSVASGFKSWVYTIWDKIKFSLSEQLRAQVASVPGGDLIGLLSEIRIALYHVEELKPHLLRNSLLCSKFEVEGAKDVLVYIAFIKNAADRLAAVGKPISDEDLQNVLVMGLPSVHFSETLQKHEKGLCQPANGLSGFSILCSEIKSYSARPTVASVLRSLKHTPGGTLMTAQGAQHQGYGGPGNAKVMLDQYVAALVAVKMKEASSKAVPGDKSRNNRKKSDKPCFDFQNASCARGSDCRFQHVSKDSTKICKMHGPGHSDEECNKQKGGGPGSRPDSKKEEEGKYHRLLMAIEGCQMEDHDQSGRVEHMAMMACGITSALSRYVVIIDDCATVHCSNDLNMAIPGTLRKTAGVIHGLGDFDITHCFDTRLSNVLDPDNPDTPQVPLLLSTVLYHPKVPFKLVISRGLLKDAGFVISIKDIADAVKPPPGGDASLKRRGIIREIVRTKSGCHVISGQTDPISGLHCAMLRDEEWAIPVARREKFESAALDGADSALALPTAGVAIGEAKPQVVSQSLPRQRSLAESAVLEQVVSRHVKLNHTCGFRTISALLAVPCPEGLKCLGCGAGAPKETSLDPLLSYECKRRSEMFSADWVPVPGVPSFGGHTGYFMIIDVFTKKLFLIPAESQQAWCAIWEAFVAVVEVHERSLRAIAFLLTDGALCFENCERCATFCREHGIQQVFSPRNNQKQNKVEGGGRHPKKVCNILMLTSGFSEQEPRLWADVLKAVNVSYDLIPPKIKNLLQTRGLTKFELWHGVEVPWETLVKRSHPVGCLTLVKTARSDRAPGFGEKVDICAFLYHEMRKKSHKLWNIEKRDYQFNSPTECDIYPTVIPLRNSSMLSKLLGQTMPALPNGVVKSPAVLVPQSQAHVGGEPEPLGVRRSARPWVPSQGFIQNVTVVAGTHTSETPSAYSADYCLTVRIELGEVLPPQELQDRTPRPLREAFQGEDAPQWKKSLLRHFAVLDSRKCFGPASTERPAGKIFPVRVLFKFKTSIAELFAGSIPDDLFKTRSVLPGNRFDAGVHFNKDEIAAEQIHPESFRMMMVYCVTHGKISVKCDAVEAFIGAEMVPRGIMCSLPQGYDPLNPSVLRSLDAPTLYAEVRAAIPGCPQGSKLFQNKAVGAYTVASWKSDPSDNMVFKKKHDFQQMADLSGLYVDDIYHIVDPDFRSLAIFLGPAPHGIGTAFPDMKYELMNGFLGMQMTIAFTPVCRSIFISNSKGVGDLLLRNGYMNRKPARTPMVAGCIISKKDCPPLGADGKLPLERRKKQQYFCGTNMHLNYFGVMTRPDIKMVVRLFATVQSNPGKPHFEALDHLLCYMLYTKDYGLEFVATPSSPKVPSIRAFADSSHADCADTSGSTQSTVTTIAGSVIASRIMVSPSACASIQMSEFGAAYSAVVQSESQPEDAAPVLDDDDHSAKNPEVSLFMAINNSARSLVWAAKMARWMFNVPDDEVLEVFLGIDNNGVLSVLKGIIHFETNKQILHRIAELRGYLVGDGYKINATKVASRDNTANALTKVIANADESERELTRLAAPRGKHPAIDYNVHGVRFKESEMVIYSNVGTLPAIVLPRLHGGSAPPAPAKIAPALLNSGGLLADTEAFVLPMIYYQASTPLGDVAASELLQYIQRYITERQSENYNGDRLLDDVTRIIAERRAAAAALVCQPPNVWEPVMDLPVPGPQPFPFPSPPPPPPPQGVAAESRVHWGPSVRWSSLSPFLQQLRSGALDNPSPSAAATIVGHFWEKQQNDAAFARILLDRGLSPLSLHTVHHSRIADLDTFLPAGASSWDHIGVYGCAVCYIPAQPTATQYAQHVVGASHALKISRFMEHFKSEPIPKGRICKVCLKVIRPELSVEAHRQTKKHKRAEASWTLVREHVA